MKQKTDFKKLALLGISTGLLTTQSIHASPSIKELLVHKFLAAVTKDKNKTDSTDSENDPNNGNMGYHLMTEEELLLELDAEGAANYKSLDAEGKELARKVASMRCNKSNPCKGLNACQDSRHDCAGKGACRGQGICAFSDKNLAVKVVKERMAKKRGNAINGNKPVNGNKPANGKF